MVTLSGRKIGPVIALNRQIGGIGYCFNNDYVMNYFFEFLNIAVERYKDHPALEIWDVGSQPELTGSMPELRRIANDPDKIGDLLCYCDHCKSKFRKWIQNKYSDIQKLNESWNQSYSSFDDIEIPEVRHNINDLIDWRMFFIYTLRKNVVKKFEVVRSIDCGRHPLMCNDEAIQCFPVAASENESRDSEKSNDSKKSRKHAEHGIADSMRFYEYRQPVISA
jgi:hypothetical protein